ncbi:hypothetical protein CAOG_01262 [Capsaspora owczarzaki ATCC 30864]|uniref:Dolichyl-diphosphooligosaccharide-protein glycosyltransferase subunit OST5 n=1 Tax=Capsaspora owczarzaki (strain ATCC 30864) TaxID=595528 RepID=A0A0D2VIL9_CAPO3|nr:hypothetical protein CAOG_01262 [Capsaspora owczarzaki ATCC 30864]KJE89837.1 hypothetical protein CAOG_001262 [Capsaspora owczarzaki ATCC 30864]|eukprot:XP_004349782.1 hypothetical protein CAOG_01262 [Capsaspora owczarzaki ATCC 30864]
MAEYTPYNAPLNPASFSTLAFILIVIGLIFAGTFFVQQVTTSKQNRNLVQELSGAGLASVFLGFGTLFLLLTVGIYV